MVVVCWCGLIKAAAVGVRTTFDKIEMPQEFRVYEVGLTHVTALSSLGISVLQCIE